MMATKIAPKKRSKKQGSKTRSIKKHDHLKLGNPPKASDSNFQKIWRSDLFQFGKNTLLFIVLMSMCYTVTREDRSYHWLYNNLLIGNLEFAFGKKGEFDLTQKYEMKLGFNHKYLNFIKEKTPEDAIILMPNQDVFMQKDSEVEFRHHIASKGYATFFLYPRKVVYEREKDKNPFYQQATHVAIVNEWGYDKITYPVNSRQKYTVLPIRK